MDIGAPTMTTLIDDGLVESCLDDPTAVIDLDQFPVIDIDNIDAIIEDPGYILDEDPDTLNRTEVYKPSDKKRSFALPVTFFDIDSNISLLKKCRPISIKIVDCNIYPWYYRKNKLTVQNSSTVYNSDEDLDQYTLRYDSPDLIDLTCCDTHVNDEVNSTLSINSPKINLSSEQRSVVLKLKEDIDNQAYLNEVYKNNVDEIDKEAAPLKNYEDLTKVNRTLDVNTSECNFNNRIEDPDLLTYKEIAQTIVRNIEQNAVSNKVNNMYVQNTNTNKTSENDISINLKDSVINIPKIPEERAKISTSPILPYTIKHQKKTKSREKKLPTPRKPKANSIMERCIDSNKNCDKFMSSVNQVIPHYHSKLSVQANNNNNVYFTNMVANQMYLQEPICVSSSLHCHQQSNKKDVLSGNSGTISAYDSQGRLVTGPYRVAEVAYEDLSKELCKNPPFNSEITKDQFNVQNGNSLRFVRRSANQLGNENYDLFPQTSNPSNNFYENNIPNSTCLQHNYVNYSSVRIPMQRQVTNVHDTIRRHPLLSQALNTNNSREYYQYIHVHSGLDPRPVTSTSSVSRVYEYPSMGQNIRLPPRPPLPDPGYAFYCPLTHYTQHENFQCSNAGNLSQYFQNIGNTNLFQDKVNFGLINLGSIPNKPRSDYNSLKGIPIDPPNVTVSMASRVDPMKQNIYPQIELQNISQASSGCCGTIRPKMFINTNANIIQQNVAKGPVKPKRTKDVKKTKKNNLDAMINVLSTKKPDWVSSRVHKRNAEEKKIILKENIINPVKQHGIPELNQLDTKSQIDGVSKTYYTIVPPSNKDINTPEKIESKVNGYSPPILQIPSLEKSLEMLSGIQNPRKLTGNNYFEADANKMALDISKDRRNNQDLTNITRKRKLFVEEKVYGNSKRISLQEYKQRRSENIINI